MEADTFKTSEQIVENAKTTENFDINALTIDTTTQIETTTIPQNIDINTYQTSELIEDTTTTPNENLDLNSLTLDK